MTANSRAIRWSALDRFRDAATRAGVNPDPFLANVDERLRAGDELYGTRYLADGWDGAREALEELEDTVAYLVLELERAVARQAPDPDLVERNSRAAALVAAAHQLIREAGA